MTMRYQTTRADDASLRQRMRAIAQERRRFGYRRLHVLLKREGYLINLVSEQTDKGRIYRIGEGKASPGECFGPVRLGHFRRGCCWQQQGSGNSGNL
jgi:hypothetical protein